MNYRIFIDVALDIRYIYELCCPMVHINYDDYISFLNFEVLLCCRCFSDIGRSFMANNPTSLSLGKMCLSKGLILHELMHALGM